MKINREYIIQEVTYKYENEDEKEVHIKQMISDGYTVCNNPYYFFTPLEMTYQKRRLNDGIPRI